MIVRIVKGVFGRICQGGCHGCGDYDIYVLNAVEKTFESQERLASLLLLGGSLDR